MGPLKWELDFVVTEAVPGRRIAWRTTGGGPFTGDLTLDLEPSGMHSTRATYHGQIKLHGLWRLLSPIIAMEARESEARELRRLQALLEEPAPAAGEGPGGFRGTRV